MYTTCGEGVGGELATDRCGRQSGKTAICRAPFHETPRLPCRPPSGGRAGAGGPVARKPGERSDGVAHVLPVQDFWSPTLHNSDGTLNIVQFRGAIPFTFGGVNNIARPTLPYVTESPSGETGLSDATIFNLAAFDQPWGRYGIGAVALLPTGADGVSAEKWGLGPALGFTARPAWGLYGLFNQNIFTVAGDDDAPDVNISTLQPILNVPLGNGWAAGSSDMTFVWDWDTGRVRLPAPRREAVEDDPHRRAPGADPAVSYEHNFYDEGVGPEDTFGVTAKLLVPKGG